MAMAPRYLAAWRLRVWLLAVALALVACDLSPLAGADGHGAPVETVTASEIPMNDLDAGATAQARHGAPTPR
jgi:hypothetical protein